MKLRLSFSNALARYLRADLPRLDNTDESGGRQPLSSDATVLAWQCHLAESSTTAAGTASSIVAIEAYSRYCIIMPVPLQPELDDIIQQLNYRWSTEMAMYILDDPEAPLDDIEELASALLETVSDTEVVRNTDLSISGHITDTIQSMQAYCQQHQLPMLSDRHSVNLAMQLNEIQKTAKDQHGYKQRFLPLPRFVDLGLAMLEDDIEAEEQPAEEFFPPRQSATVISLAEYRRKVGR